MHTCVHTQAGQIREFLAAADVVFIVLVANHDVRYFIAAAEKSTWVIDEEKSIEMEMYLYKICSNLYNCVIPYHTIPDREDEVAGLAL